MCELGIAAFTESVRIELGKSGEIIKIRITSLSSRLVKTSMTENYTGFNPYL